MTGEVVDTGNEKDEVGPFAREMQEVDAFDPEKQFMNKWGASIKNRMQNAVDTPIDEAMLAEMKIEDGLKNTEWERQFVDPYVYGIYASTGEIGALAEQFAKDEGGLGVDKSIRGATKLFAEIFGLKRDIAIEPLPKENNSDDSPWGVYRPGTDTLWFNFGKANEAYEGDANEMAIEMISTIAHEAWHARQDGIMKGGPTLRKAFYVENSDNYIGPEGGYHGYRNQLIEDEAHTIENAVKETLEKVFPRNREAFINNPDACAELKSWSLNKIREKERVLENHNL